ncbi:HSF-type DNA-binding protein [Nitzschia inconspicua]|uniref:HSF-type DNA-binding protein n=1 Tax=Nitzschia inconspicua TaxID=303405 RepID=A0A9K3KBU6_9STRA|nr:HSF-type DNA-binding protein [Nitzschia inconspicua]
MPDKLQRHVSVTSQKSLHSFNCGKSHQRARFPMKLRALLDDASMEGNEHIVSWLPHGKSFKVHKPELFASVLMRRYFRQSHFRSFTRQLYHYGFERCEEGAFSHPQFQRDNASLSLTMGRKLKVDDDPLSISLGAAELKVTPSTKEAESITFGQLNLGFVTDPFLLDPFSKSPEGNNRSNITAQETIQTATHLSNLMLEPRPIEQMTRHPMDVEEALAEFWPTTEV